MKFILVPSIYDKNKCRREPVSLYGADDYIDDHDLSTQLLDKIDRLAGSGEAEKPPLQGAGPRSRPEVKGETVTNGPSPPRQYLTAKRLKRQKGL